jgi:hypothetical protein
MSADVAVPLIAHRTWQRKWRDVQHASVRIEKLYAGDQIDVDDATRTIEDFFKLARELADWIQESTGHPAIDYIPHDPTLQVCDAIAQTAKHHTRSNR